MFDDLSRTREPIAARLGRDAIAKTRLDWAMKMNDSFSRQPQTQATTERETRPF